MSVIVLGLANWFATVLLVDSEIFRPVRVWVHNRWSRAQALEPFWAKIDYAVTCAMCTGMWLALVETIWAPTHSVASFIITALAVKAIGHVLYVGHKYVECLIRCRTLESQSTALDVRLKGKELFKKES